MGLGPVEAGVSVWISAPKPKFPEAALRKGTERYVVVRARIASDGSIAAAAIARSSGDTTLDEAARNAVLNWKMNPAAIKPEYRSSGYNVRFDFRQEAPIAVKYRDRAAYFSTYRSAQMWKHVSIPEYPIHERGVKAAGTTMVGVTIGAGGEVVSVELVKTSGYPNLDKAALAAVRLWRAHDQYSGRRVVVPVQFTPQALRRR
jgi:TonB family protein